MPFGPLIAGIGGSVLGALGGSGKQGSQQTSQNTSSTQNIDMTHTGSTKYNEDPLFAAFRQKGMNALGSQLDAAQKPIFGDAQKAAFMSQLNDLTNQSMKSLQSKMARSGGLNSGAMLSGMGNLELGRLGQLGSFFSQLPFQEAQAQSARINPLLQTIAGWTGRAPIDSTTTETQKGTTTGTGTMSGTTSMFGPSFGTGLASNLGGLGGMMFGNWLNSPAGQSFMGAY